MPPLHAKCHIWQSHSTSTQSDHLLLPPLSSTITQLLLFFAIMFLACPFFFCHRRPEDAFSGNVVLIFSEHMTVPSPLLLAMSTSMSSCHTISLSSLLGINFGPSDLKYRPQASISEHFQLPYKVFPELPANGKHMTGFADF